MIRQNRCIHRSCIRVSNVFTLRTLLLNIGCLLLQLLQLLHYSLPLALQTSDPVHNCLCALLQGQHEAVDIPCALLQAVLELSFQLAFQILCIRQTESRLIGVP